MNICAYTSICEEDLVWVPQYLDEVERLGMPFCVHLDRVKRPGGASLIYHNLCRGFTEYDGDDEFTEQDKQGVFDLTARSGADWAMAWDIDETWDPKFSEKVKRLSLATMETVDVPWLNLWGDAGHCRTDGAFAQGHRVKFYNLRSGRDFKFLHPVVNGPKSVNGSHFKTNWLDVCCVHHGMMTHELRVQHKERWDRIYTASVGANPYGFWNFALAYEEYPPQVCTLAERLERYP